VSVTARSIAKAILPGRLTLGLRRAMQARRESSYRRRGVFELDVNSREWACRDEFFYNAFKALTFNGISGDYCEFGSHGCVTFRLAYKHSRRLGHNARQWAFDSFAGFPASTDIKDEHPKWRTGGMSFALDQFNSACELAGIPASEYTVVPGFYDHSLPPLGRDGGPQDICLAYIDCDMYTSTKTVLDFLGPRLKHGMIIAFDDYYCWSATQPSGERLAMRHAFPDDGPWELVPYLTIGWAGASFVVEARQ
jgi:O-methyltransferase